MAESKPNIGSGILQINLVNSELEDTVGAAVLSLIALLLIIALMRAHGQNRRLIRQLMERHSSIS